MTSITATDAIPTLDLDSKAPAKLRLDTSSHGPINNKMAKSEAQKAKKMAESPVSPSGLPIMCKDILSNDERWASFDATATEYACASESEQGSASDSDPWSDDEDDDLDEFVLCLTSRGVRRVNSTNRLCPQLPRRFSFRPLEDIHHVSQTSTLEDEARSEKACIEPVIFQNNYFTVSESQIAGWGAFAAKDLKYGDKILIEQPLFKADNLSLFKEFDKLDPNIQQVALELHANQMCKPGIPKLQAIWNANCFSTGIGDIAGLFPVASRFNHSCSPNDNIEYVFKKDDDMLEMTVKVDTILAGEELTISYGAERTPLDLFLRYGFRCRCGACPGLTENDAGEW